MADLGSKKVRKSNFSPEEVETLVNTVSKHYNILYGEFAKRAVNKHARHRVWLDVTKQVNRVSIERRTLQEVKNKWKKCQHLYRDPDQYDYPEDFVVPNVWEPLTTIKDSMPLEQRLSKNSAELEPVLQSQPLSPTKLKVTRQAAKPSQPTPKPPTPEPPNEEVCLRWNSHHSNMQTTFPNLLLREQYIDATLVAEGQTLKCHRLILSSCSPYFEEVLSGISPFQHPVLFMKDIPFWILKSLCDFMYAGEVHIFQNKLEELLAVAEMLKIKGLAGKTESPSEETKPSEPVKEEKKKHPQPVQQAETPATKPSSKSVKSSQTAKKTLERAHKEIVKSDDILDPLDLLEPVYEELTKESKPAAVQPKFRECKNLPVKKVLPKKLKKRKLSEEREESPPPMFLSRKGTRSRPNVKIPKYYHTHFERAGKNLEFPESTIVREPHTDQADPLMEVEEIKAEPLDFQDDVIEIEDNLVSFSDQEMPSLQEEEIIGNYDSPIVNINDNSMDVDKDLEDPPVFKKIGLLPQPIIMDVHSIAEKSPSSSTLKIVDVAQITGPTDASESKTDDPLHSEITVDEVEIGKESEDPLNLSGEAVKENASDITITNVESIADVDAKEPEEKSDNHKLDIRIANVMGEYEETDKDEADPDCHATIVTSDVTPDVHIAMVVSENELPIEDDANLGLNADKDEEHPDCRATKVPNDADPGVAIVTVVSENELAKEDDANPSSNADKHEDLPDGHATKAACDADADVPLVTDVSVNEPAKSDDANPSPNFLVEKAVNEYQEEAAKGGSGGDADPACHEEKVVNDNECEDNEESTALGFHIAKVASEQFAMNEARHDKDKSVISEDCAGELGFQITNVVSGHLEDSDGKVNQDSAQKDSNRSELETIANDLSGEAEESLGKREAASSPSSGLANMNNAFGDETRCIADTLEELLEK